MTHSWIDNQTTFSFITIFKITPSSRDESPMELLSIYFQVNPTTWYIIYYKVIDQSSIYYYFSCLQFLEILDRSPPFLVNTILFLTHIIMCHTSFRTTLSCYTRIHLPWILACFIILGYFYHHINIVKQLITIIHRCCFSLIISTSEMKKYVMFTT